MRLRDKRTDNLGIGAVISPERAPLKHRIDSPMFSRKDSMLEKLRLLIAGWWAFVSVALLVLVVLVVRGCKAPQPPAKATEPLQPNEIARVVVEPRRVAVTTKEGTKTQYVPAHGSVVASVDKTGAVSVAVKNKGFSHNVGIGGAYADRFRGVLDVEVLYWDRFGVCVGLGIADSPVVSPYLAAAYRLEQLKLDNTSLFVGMTAKKDFIIGLRVEL